MKIILPALALLAAACTPGQRQGAQSALDAVQVACLIANSTLADDKVAEVCGVVGPMLDPMRRVLASARTERVKATEVGRAEGLRMKVGCAPQ